MLLGSLLLGAALASAPPMSPAGSPVPTPQFRRYGVADGLPGSDIYTVVQGPKGMIWIGTHAGLARYDGVSFTVYRHTPSDSESLTSNDVSSVLADSKGRIWAGGEGSGVNLLQPGTQHFSHWRHADDDPQSLAGNDVMALAEGSDGSLWVGLFGVGLDHMDTQGRFSHLQHKQDDPTSLASNIILSLHAGAKGRLWIGTAKGLDLREAGGHLRHVRFPGAQAPPRIWQIKGHAGDLHVATSVGLFRVDAALVAHPMAQDMLGGKNIITVTKARDGSLWAGGIGGLYWLGKDGRRRHFPPQPLLPGGQPGSTIWQVMLDHEGGLWLATSDAGVAYLSPDWKDFSRFTHVPDDQDSLSSSRVVSLLAAGDDALWVGGQRGQLDHLDLAAGHVTHLAAKLDLTSVAITALADAGAGNLWVGYHNGLGLFDGKTLKHVSAPLLHGGARWMTADSQGRAYVSPPGAGVLQVDPTTLKVREVGLARIGEAAKETSQLSLHDGTLWRASHAGLSRLAADGLNFVSVPGVAPGQVSAFAFSGTDLWLTRVNALEHYHVQDGHATRVARIDAAAGWPGLTVKALLVDAQQRVWIPAEVGLWRYDSRTRRFRRFGVGEGLPTPEFSSNNLVRLHDGSVYAGTLGGVIGFRPEQLHGHPRKPALVLTGLSTQRDGKTHALGLHGPVKLAWDDRELRVEVRALSYISPRRNHYRFRLDGFDPHWVDTGNQGMREFAGLGAGDYTLRIQAAGPSGQWSDLGRSLRVHVDAPPWLRPWAWATYVILAALLAWWALAVWKRRVDQRHRVQLAEQQRVLAEQANAAKTQFLATLGHEIRTPMTGVLGMAELLLYAPLAPRQHEQVEAIQRSGELLLKLVNDALDLARIEAGRLELELAPLDPRALLRDVAQLQSGLAARKGLDFSTDVMDGVPARVLGDGLRIKQILLNLVGNALKFTEVGGVVVQLRSHENGLKFRISDTGPGISDASQSRLFKRFEQADGPQRAAGSGLGLAICRELTALMGGRLDLSSQIGVGSTFEMWLPLPEVAATDGAKTATHQPVVRALRLLLVEDDPIVAEALSGLLQAQGHKVTHAPHGLNALSHLQQGDFDAVLLDLDLPGIDGFRVAQMVRQGQANLRLPIIAITARSGGDEEQRAGEVGMNGFLRKPVTGERLASELKRALEAGGD